MKIQCFHSSSAGNLYSINNGTTQIMIECGVEFKEIQKCFSFNLSSLAGCLLTHEHKDHSKSWDKVAKYTPVYMLEDTAKALKASGYNIKHYSPLETFKLGTFNVLPIPARHDVSCCSFIIKSTVTNEIVLFMTDTAYLKHKITNVHYAMVECNYQMSVLNNAVDNGYFDTNARNRIVASHSDLDTTVKLLKGLNQDLLKEVYVLHLSNRHANIEEVKKTIEQEVGKPVYLETK